MIPARQKFSDHVFTDAEPHPTETHDPGPHHRQVLQHRHDDREPRPRGGEAGAVPASVRLRRPQRLAFPGEAKGILEGADDWQGTERYTVAYGQGVAVTAVQLAAAMNTIANRGTYVAPRLVQSTIGRDGQEARPRRPNHPGS